MREATMRWTAFAAFAGALLLAPGAMPAQQAGGQPGQGHPQMFETGNMCVACHNGMVTPSGEDISIGKDWQTSMMANSARDPYWQASIRRETLMHPSASEAIQDECSTCHMPMSRYRAKVGGAQGEIFTHLPFIHGDQGAVKAATRQNVLAADGVSCTVCHQIQPDGLGTEESFVGGFVIDSTTAWDQREIFGPFAVDTGRTRLMHSASAYTPRQGSHIQESELCASCHTLYTHTLNEEGESIGELPEQVPYLEWLNSDYRDEQSCQDCHMPVVEQEVAVTGVLGQPRDSVNRHVFRGGNFFMQRIFARYGDELGVQATSQQFSTAARRTIDHLETSSARMRLDSVSVRDQRLTATVAVTNLAGHKLPTAYPSRRAWIHLTVRDRNGRVVFESGALNPDGSISGNDNDRNPRAFEPHYDQIAREEEVQIYEAIMVDPDGTVTTGLLEAIRFTKDNRILPKGFTKGDVPEDVAVQGRAAGDGDFTGSGDRVRYSVDVAGAEGPFSVQAELWYQPISYRWAHNLEQQDAEEIDRFVRYYESMSESSGTILARAGAETDSGGSAVRTDGTRPRK